MDAKELLAYLSVIVTGAPCASEVNNKSSFFKESHFTVFAADPALRSLKGYNK